jgi:hypothetical protein
MNISDVAFFLPEPLVLVSPAFLEEIREHGVLAPIMIAGEVTVDGHRRLKAARTLGHQHIPHMEITGDPAFLYWKLNASRPWNPVETAWVYSRLAETARPGFCQSLGLTLSPHVARALAHVAAHPALWPGLLENRLTIPILRDLAHFDTPFERLVTFFLGLEATLGEKRLLAGLFKQCHSRRVFPETFEGLSFADAVKALESLVQPRRCQALQTFREALAEVQLPAGVSVQCDPTFEKPGVDVTIRLKRHQLERLQETRNKLELLFTKCPEL